MREEIEEREDMKGDERREKREERKEREKHPPAPRSSSKRENTLAGVGVSTVLSNHKRTDMHEMEFSVLAWESSGED